MASNKSYVKPPKVNSRNLKACEKGMWYYKTGQPYIWGGCGQMLCKKAKSTISGWAKNNAGKSNWNHVLGKDKDANGKNWKWTLDEDSTGYVCIDCSGLTKQSYADIGIELSHCAKYQKNAKYEVPMDQAQPGDVLWKEGHVGMVGEDGKHAVEAKGWRYGCTYDRDIHKFEKCYHYTMKDDDYSGASNQQQQQQQTTPPSSETENTNILSASAAKSAISYNDKNNKSICTKIQQLVGCPVTGSFDTATVNAIAVWQKSKGLVADGKFGAKSKEAAQFSSQQTTEPPKTEQTTEPPKTEQTVDPQSAQVTLTKAQQDSAISYNNKNNKSICKQIQSLVGVTVDGKFGPKTVNAIASWQAGKGLDADGKFGKMSKAAANF